MRVTSKDKGLGLSQDKGLGLSQDKGLGLSFTWAWWTFCLQIQESVHSPASTGFSGKNVLQVSAILHVALTWTQPLSVINLYHLWAACHWWSAEAQTKIKLQHMPQLQLSLPQVVDMLHSDSSPPLALTRFTICQSSWNIWMHSFEIYGRCFAWSKQPYTHTCAQNAVTLVWGSLNFIPGIPGPLMFLAVQVTESG